MATSSFYQSSGSTPAVENTISEQVEIAQTSAATASAAATTATASANTASSALTSFQTYYLGAFAVAPTTSQPGAQYFDTVSNQLKIWNGSQYEIANTSSNISNSLSTCASASNTTFASST